MRRLAVVLTIVALFGAACGNDNKDTSSTTTSAADTAKASTFTVEVDAPKGDFATFQLAYFPNALTARPGDTVKFHSNDSGEPHTVTFGTIADASVKAFKALPPEVVQSEDDSKIPAETKAIFDATNAKLPSMLPDGPGDANQASANPCFVAAGDPPTDKQCPKVAPQPDFTGTESVYSSGYLPDDAEFSMTLADTIAPGTYSWFCLLHREGMTGELTVVAKGQAVQSPAEVAVAGTKALDEVLAKMRPTFETLASATPDKAVAGIDVEGVQEAGIAEFGPREASIPVGGSVTWNVAGPHTIGLNMPESARGLMAKAPDGTFHANEKAFAPAGGPGAPPPAEGEPKPDAKPILVDGGTFDGTGAHSSGILAAFGPPGYQYKLTFTKAGTYKYVCQVHPDMEGTVKVG